MNNIPDQEEEQRRQQALEEELLERQGSIVRVLISFAGLWIASIFFGGGVLIFTTLVLAVLVVLLFITRDKINKLRQDR